MDQSPNAVVFFGILDPAIKTHNQYAKLKLGAQKRRDLQNGIHEIAM